MAQSYLITVAHLLSAFNYLKIMVLEVILSLTQVMKLTVWPQPHYLQVLSKADYTDLLTV